MHDIIDMSKNKLIDLMKHLIKQMTTLYDLQFRPHMKVKYLFVMQEL